MTALRLSLVIWLLASAVPSAGPASVPPTEGPDAALPSMWLRGPFGRVPGLAPDQALSPDAPTLDAYVLDAPLVLDAGEQGTRVAGFTVDARPLDGSGDVERLSVDEVAFTGPSTPGRHLLVVRVVARDGATSEFAWRLDVPDRPAPEDGLLDIPAPDVIVESSSGSVAGWPGDGCYLYLCVDVGRPPFASELPALTAAPGEVLGARVSDGSPIVAWKGSLRPLPGEPGLPRTASGVLTDEAEEIVGLTGLELPASGTWLLTLEVEFYRERGWMRTHYRIVPEGDP